MRLVKDVTQDEVWSHWFRIERYESYKSLTGQILDQEVKQWRSDIKRPLPPDIRWHEAVIEQGDMGSLFIISSDDWAHISRNNFLANSVADNLDAAFSHKDSLRISSDIKQKLSFLESGGTLDTRLIIVADKITGPFTIIEGNRRSVALLRRNELVGTVVYIGISRNMTDFCWSRYSYRSDTANKELT